MKTNKKLTEEDLKELRKIKKELLENPPGSDNTESKNEKLIKIDLPELIDDEEYSETNQY